MIRQELRPMLALATPVVMAELGWVTMGIVDTVMVGGLGAGAIGAVGLPPLLLYVAFRRYLQAMNLVKPVMFALFAANLVNGVANWILIYGHLGAPAMGVRGSAVATLAARIFMAGWLLIAILRHEAHVTP